MTPTQAMLLLAGMAYVSSGLAQSTGGSPSSNNVATPRPFDPGQNTTNPSSFAVQTQMEFSWSGGLAARLCGAVEQAESRAEVCRICFGCSVEERAWAFAAGASNLRRRRGGHAVAWLGFEAGVE